MLQDEVDMELSERTSQGSVHSDGNERPMSHKEAQRLDVLMDIMFRYIHSVCHPQSKTSAGRVTHICVSKLTIIGSDNGLSPGRRQAIIWTNAGILLIGPYGTNFSEILIEILAFSFTKMSLKVSSAKWRPFCLSLNVLTHWSLGDVAGIWNVRISNVFNGWYRQ